MKGQRHGRDDRQIQAWIARLGIDGSELVEEVEQTLTQAAQPWRAAKRADA
jgi:hypothetical protein